MILRKIRNNLLFNESHFEILKNCNYSYANKISKSVNLTWSYISEILNCYEYLGLIKRIKQGRIMIIDLTDDGKKLVAIYHQLYIPLKDKIREFKPINK